MLFIALTKVGISYFNNKVKWNVYTERYLGRYFHFTENLIEHKLLQAYFSFAFTLGNTRQNVHQYLYTTI